MMQERYVATILFDYFADSAEEIELIICLVDYWWIDPFDDARVGLSEEA